MIHPHTELRFISERIGYGVVATQFIPKGTITWTLDKLDRTFTPPQVKAMDPLYQQVLDTYTYRNAEGNYILCWDNARFINHSSKSNCITTAYEFEIAIRDILPGDQLTDDYGYLNLDEPFEAEPEAGTHRTTIFPDDLIRYYHEWDDLLLSAFPYLSQVSQPLMNILEPALREKALQIAAGKENMSSILTCYYPVYGKVNGVAQLIQRRMTNVVYPF